MRVSIVLPILNGEETLKDCLNAIAEIDYPKGDFELIVVNDGSKDRTDEIVKEFVGRRGDGLNVKYINLKKNVGRIKARLKGVEEANYENLLFIDHRCIVYKDIVKEIEKKRYQPIIGNPFQNRKENIVSNFFYVLRKIIYFPYWGKDFEDVYISRKNFNQIPKGFSPFFCNKKLLLRNIPTKKGKNISDDTLVFNNIVKEKDILKTSDCKVEYSERNIGEGFFDHLFNRGPKFIHFYFPKSNKYKIIIILLALSPIIFLSLLGPFFLFFELIYIFAGLLILTLSFISLRYKLDIRDMVSIVLIGPIVWLIFTLGIWKGVFIKFFNRFDR